MSNYNNLKTTIDANIKQNGNQEITGPILNSVLNQMVTTLGAGYQFAGIATIATNPGSPDAKVFYIANGKGTYEKFGGINVTEDDVVVLYWDSSWHKVSTGIASNDKLTELFQQTASIYHSYNSVDIINAYENVPINFVIKKGCIIKNTSEHVIAIGTDDNLSNRINIAQNTFSDILEYDYLHVKNLSTPQIVSFEVINPSATFIPKTITESVVIDVNKLSNNTSAYSSKEDARKAVSSESGFRKMGQVITYMLADGWHTEQFIGSDINQWGVDDAWEVLLRGNKFIKKNAGVNLFDESNSYAGILDKNGDITSASESYLSHSDFIEIDGNSSYFLSARLSLGGYGYLCYYDKNKALITPTIAMVSENMLLTPPVNAKYLRFSFRNNYPKNQIQLNIGTKKETFREYTPIGQYCAEKIAKGAVTSEEIKDETIKYSNIEDNTIPPSKTNFFNVGENIFNPNHYRNVYGYILNDSGKGITDLEFNTSDYISIMPNTRYFFSIAGSTMFPTVICCYNEQKELISYERNQRYITTPESAVWMRISCRKEKWEYVMVVKTDTYPSAFIPFGYYLQPNLIKDNSIEISKLKQKVFPKEFGCLSNSGEIASGETLTTAKVNIKQSLLLSYHIDGTIDDIDIGVGYDGTTEEYARTNFKITSGNIIVGSKTYPLGLALGNRTDISISSKGYGSTTPVTITITNEFGDVFSQEISGIGTGTPYIKNNGDSGLNVTIKFFPRDITKKIWIFGDSYVSFVSPARWPYYLVSKGYENFMCNSLPGARADRMIEELRNLLATGAKPTYLLWCLGMNGGGDTYSNGEFVLNQMQKVTVDAVISICKENKIIPILQTIPTVSNNGSPIYHKAYTAYIKSLGYRYVDIDNAVGSQDDGTWTAGLLDDDGVHPSVQGAKVICARFLSDFPELSIIE